MDIHTQHHFRPFNSDGSHHEIPCLLNVLHALSRMNEIRIYLYQKYSLSCTVI